MRRAARLFNIFFQLARWHLVSLPLKKIQPLFCNFYITNRCNFRCRFCFIDDAKEKKTIGLELFKRIVLDLREMGCIYLYICGGEPLLVKNLHEYLSFARRHIPYLHLVTNGSLLDEKTAKQFAAIGLDEVSISIDAMEEQHNALRLDKEAFKKAFLGLKNLKEFAPRTKATCATIIAPATITSQRELHALCKKLGIAQRYFALVNFRELGQEDQNRKKLNQESEKEIRKFVEEIRRSYPERFDVFLKFIPRFYEAMGGGRPFDLPIFASPCLVPFFYINVLESGEVFPCLGTRSSLKLGGGFFGEKKVFMADGRGLKDILLSNEYRETAMKLLQCDLCKDHYSSCYMRTRFMLPLTAYFWRLLFEK